MDQFLEAGTNTLGTVSLPPTQQLETPVEANDYGLQIGGKKKAYFPAPSLTGFFLFKDVQHHLTE